MSDLLSPRDPRGLRGRIYTPTPRSHRHKPMTEVAPGICYAHGEQPKESCSGCIHWWESDRDHDALQAGDI